MARALPPPALLYQGLGAGSNWIRDYEIQEGVPIDGSKALLRDPKYGSPFTLRVVPPPALVDALATTRSDPTQVAIIDAALETNDDFDTYTKQVESFRASSFVVKTPQDLTRLETFVGDNGVFFNARTGSTSLANMPAVSDLRQAASVIAQLNQILKTPPLTLLVNPQSFTITRSKVQQYSDRNRKGYIFQSWGQEQVRLSIQGKIGAFIAGAKETDGNAPENFRGLGAERGRLNNTSVASGVQYASKRDSAAWQNLMSLFTIYRNNGYIYDQVTKTEAHQWIGGVAIDYDQMTYIGHFNNFTWTYDETTQLGGIEFTTEFTCSAVFDNKQRQFAVTPLPAPTPSPSDPLWNRGNGGAQPLVPNPNTRTVRIPLAAVAGGALGGATGAVIGAGAVLLRKR